MQEMKTREERTCLKENYSCYKVWGGFEGSQFIGKEMSSGSKENGTGKR